MRNISSLVLFVVLLSGCSDAPQATSSRRPAGEVILACVRTSGEKLDAALANGDVASVARQIVQTLDDYEDSPAMKRFEEFHREMEQLESLSKRESASEELAAKIAEVKAIADRLSQ